MPQQTLFRLLAWRSGVGLALAGLCLLPSVSRAQSAALSLPPLPGLSAAKGLSVHDESLLANAPFDNMQAIRGALARGAHIEARDGRGRTALLLAAGYNATPFDRVVEQMKQLQEISGLEQQTGVGYSDNRITFSMRDAQDLRSAPAQYLLGLGAKQTVDAQSGRIFLTWEVAGSGGVSTLQILLDAGANINAQDHNGKTALITAIENINRDAVRLLLQRNADVNIRDNAGFSALGYAASGDSATIVQELQTHGAVTDAHSADGSALLNFAIRQQNITLVRDLLDKGAAVGGNGRFSPLDAAVRADNIAAARLLIERGANVNGKGLYPDLSVLGEAFEWGSPEMALLLLEKGADVNGTTLWQRSYLSEAAAEANLELMKTLLNKGADVNAHSPNGDTPLFSAIAAFPLSFHKTRSAPMRSNWREVENKEIMAAVTLLLERGANINARASDDTTPLLLAIQRQRPEIAKFLIARRADVHSKTRRGETPLNLAAKFHDTDMVEALRAAGAKE